MRSLLLAVLLFGIALAQENDTTGTDETPILGSVLFPKVFDVITIDTLETPIQFRAILYLNFAVWNAWCNYHPTAADIFGRNRFKRPANEHTAKNKNTATLFSIYRVYQASPQSFGGPSGLPVYRKIMEDMGYDPEDMSDDLSTPIGIGNRAGFDTARLMMMDGWNSQGDLTATQENYLQPFKDYTRYKPRNDPWKLRFPFRWQPLLENNGLGFFFRQESVVPYAGSAVSFSMSPEEVNNRKLESPYMYSSARAKDAKPEDIMVLKNLAREVFRVSANLTEEQRVFAEFFDNKAKSFRSPENPEAIPGIAAALTFLVLGDSFGKDYDKQILYGFGGSIAVFDSVMLAWKEKRRLDLVRPTGQTMKFLFGNERVKVWGGPGKDAVMIKAGEWQPYIRTMPHSEFPSGSSCTCSTLVEHALINTNGTDEIPFRITIPKGSSKFYPGEIPETDFEIKIDRLTDWAKLCGQSRSWAGVHFTPSIAGGEKLCRGVGTSAQHFADELVAGRLDAKWMKWLPEGADRFWEEG